MRVHVITCTAHQLATYHFNWKHERIFWVKKTPGSSLTRGQERISPGTALKIIAIAGETCKQTFQSNFVEQSRLEGGRNISFGVESRGKQSEKGYCLLEIWH